MKNIRLLVVRLETSDCTGNLPFKRTRVKKIGLSPDIRLTKSKLKKIVCPDCVD